MDIWQILGYIGAFLTGLVLGLLGGGGALMSVPTLVYLFGVAPTTATGYSLFLVAVTATGGAYQNIRKKMVDFQAALWYGLPSLITVFCMRRFVVPSIPKDLLHIGTFTLDKDHLILLVLSAAILLVSVRMIRNTGPIADPNEPQQLNHPKLVVFAVLIGAFVGFVGAGGGFLMTPALMYYAKLDIKKAIGTSLVLVALNSLIGFVGDLSHNPDMNWPFLLLFSAFSVIGVFVGHYLQGKIEASKLKTGFGWFMLATGIYIVARELFPGFHK